MKKVFLVYPPSKIMNREERCQQPLDDLFIIPPLPPMDLMYLSSIAKNNSCEVMLKDYSLKAQTYKDFEDDLKEFKPDIVLVNVTTPTLESDVETLRIAKVVNPNILTIAKGAHFHFMPQEVLETHDFIDIAICSEAEITFDEILKNKKLEDIQGIAFRRGFEIIQTQRRPFNENLDELPYPDRDIIDNSLYSRPDTGEKQTIIKVSRGCPYHCFFCLATPINGRIVRHRSPKNIVGEIRLCVEKYGIKNFVFWSDIFNLDNNWVKELCNEIISSGLKITFSTNTRADTVDFDTVKLMKKAGCTLVSMGIESGSQEMLDKMGKKITLSQVEKSVKLFKKLGIAIYAYYVIGLPWETKSTLEETLLFAKKLNTDFVSFYTATPLLGTDFYSYIENNYLGVLNYSKPYYYPCVNTHNLTCDEVFEYHKKMVRSYYLRFSYVIEILFKIRSLKQFVNYSRVALKIFKRR